MLLITKNLRTALQTFIGKNPPPINQKTPQKPPFCCDKGPSIARYNGSELLRKFVYGPGIDEPVCMIDVAGGNKIYYYHYDGLGSVVALSDVNSEVVEFYEYDVFGRATIWDAASIKPPNLSFNPV